MGCANITNIETKISLSIFKKSMVNKPLSNFLTENKGNIESRFEEIKEFVSEFYDVELYFDEVFSVFEIYLKKMLFKEAITMLSFGDNGYNIIKILISLINGEFISNNVINNLLIKAIAEKVSSYLFFCNVYCEEIEKALNEKFKYGTK